MFLKFKKFFELDNFYKNNKELNKSNAKILLKICLSCIIFLFAYLIVLFIKLNILYLNIVFSFIVIYLLILFIIFYKISLNNFNNTKLINILTYVFVFSAYSISIQIAFISNNYPSTVFPVILVALPLLLIIQPKISSLFSIFFTALYLILSYNFKSSVFQIDLLNCLFVQLLNFLIGRYFYFTRKEEIILRQKYKHLSKIDELTELLNRRQFNINYEKIFYKSLSDKKTIALFLIDIDDFKNYNDYYGHLGGDDCLKKIGKFFNDFSEKNPSITFYRFGGEEFIGIANNLNKENAYNIADNIVKGVKDLNLKHATSKISDIITISLGAINQYPSVLSNSSDLINLADKALYKVKANGKNGFLFF